MSRRKLPRKIHALKHKNGEPVGFCTTVIHRFFVICENCREAMSEVVNAPKGNGHCERSILLQCPNCEYSITIQHIFSSDFEWEDEKKDGSTNSELN